MLKVKEELEAFRITKGPMGSNEFAGNQGAFVIRSKVSRCLLNIIVHNGIAGVRTGWEHVSISVYKQNRLPSWEEMCEVKALFWDPEDVVVQFHPGESNYVNLNKMVLHLWRSIDSPFPAPPTILV
jgi:hypothetical protein